MLEPILFVAVVVAVGAFVAMRTKLKDKDEKQSDNIEDANADRNTNQSVPQPVTEPVTVTAAQPELTDSEREKNMSRHLSLAGVDHPESETTEPSTTSDSTVTADAPADGHTAESPKSNKKPGTARRTTRSRKK